jgi:hypothetical protein
MVKRHRPYQPQKHLYGLGRRTGLTIFGEGKPVMWVENPGDARNHAAIAPVAEEDSQ